MEPLEQRLLAKIEKKDGGCWLWTGNVNRRGYGQLWMRGQDGRTWTGFAHRLAYQVWRGPIPHGLVIDHLCRVRRCVNPDHLEPVTCRENLMRGLTVNAANAAKTHCKHGHPFDEENTYIRPNGRRSCRTCVTAAGDRYLTRRRARRAEQAAGRPLIAEDS